MNLSVSFIIQTGLFLRFAIAAWNGLYGPSPGADLDALSFNGFASEVAKTGIFDDFSIGFIPYTNLLGVVYALTFNHVLTGSLLSCLIWWWSADVLSKSFVLLAVDKQRIKKAMLIYALLPSSIFLTSITLREPYQLFFINLAVFAVMKIYLHKSIAHWFTLFLAIAGAGVLHGGLLAFVIIFLAFTLIILSMREKKGISWAKLGLMGAVAVVVLWYGFSLFSNISYNLDNGLDSEIEIYQQDLLTVDARTHYKSDAQFSDLGGSRFFALVGLLQYLFEPFPWHISDASDIVALLENILRGWLIWQAGKMVRIKSAQRRRMALFVFILYFVMETIWSFGTINWGTSIRHHLPALGLLLLAAYASSEEKVRVKMNKWHFRYKNN